MVSITQLATVVSPIISVIAIVVALIIARSSSKDARQQITAIHRLLDVFVAANNLDIIEAQRKYKLQLDELDMKIESARCDVETVSPFRSGVRIERIIEQEKKKDQIKHMDSLLAKRKEIKINLLLIQDYINKATK